MPKTLKTQEEMVGLAELKTPALWKALAAEVLGTLFLVLFGCASTLSGEGTDVTKVSLTFGFTLACLVQALDHISGCHVNPSVTIGFLVARYMSVTRTVTYIIAQCIGGVLGSAVLYGITPEGSRFHMGVSRFGLPDLTEGQGFGVEVLCTFMLVLTIFGTTDDRRTDVKGSVSLGIALAAITTHLFGIPYTGASLNPARTFGPALVVGGDAWEHHWVYWAGPLVGGALAALVYKNLFRGTKGKVPPGANGGPVATPLINMENGNGKKFESIPVDDES